MTNAANSDVTADVLAHINRRLFTLGLAIVVPGLLAICGGGAAFYVTTMTQAARAEEVHLRMDREMISIRGNQQSDSESLVSLVRDMAALSASFDAQSRDTSLRLSRIEAGLDRVNGDDRRRPRITRSSR